MFAPIIEDDFQQRRIRDEFARQLHDGKATTEAEKLAERFRDIPMIDLPRESRVRGVDVNQ